MTSAANRDSVQGYYQALWAAKSKARGERSAGVGPTRVDVAARLLQSGERLLDVGCWGGQALGRMGAALRYRELYGIDLIAESVAEARRRGIRAERVDLNQQGLPFADAYFDAVTCLAVIAQVFDPIGTLAELVRVLRPGGQLLLSVPNVAALPNCLALLRGRLPRTSPDPGWDGGQLHYFTLDETRKLLCQSGLEVVGVYATGRWLGLRQRWPALLSRDLLFDARR